MSAVKKAKSQKKKSKQVAGEAATVREAQPAEPIRPIITLTTDFGDGYYAGATKGAILDVCPQACLVDITHQITSHDVLEASFSLLCSYPYYPLHTVHLVIVDPGVGSYKRNRRILGLSKGTASKTSWSKQNKSDILCKRTGV